MDDKNWWDTVTLIKCENDECGGYSFKDELEKNNWECPHCGKPISKPFISSFEGSKEMTDEKRSDTVLLIRCENEQCRKQVYETELEENDWKCPYCGKPIAKPK